MDGAAISGTGLLPFLRLAAGFGIRDYRGAKVKIALVANFQTKSLRSKELPQNANPL